MKEPLSWVKDLAWQRVVVESYYSVQVQAVRSKASMVYPFGRIIEDCRQC